MNNYKVIWSEGMFLKPQHFQQHDRYIENQYKQSVRLYKSFSWGIKSLSIDEQFLGLGKIIINHCDGVMPDGTAFSIKNSDELPLVFNVNDEVKDEIIYLVLPISSEGNPEVKNNLSDSNNDNLRYFSEKFDIRDNNEGCDSVAQVHVGRLFFSLKTDSQIKGNTIALALCKVVESRPDKTIILDDDFIPPVLDCSASSNLNKYHKEIISLLKHRADSIASRITQQKKVTTSDLTDFLLLQLVNKNEALFNHLLNLDVLHPEVLFKNTVTLYGELSTFTSQGRKPEFTVQYSHEDLSGSFLKLMSGIRQSLSMVLEQNALQLILQERNYGIRVATLKDKGLLKTAEFVLAVKASVSNEDIRSKFPVQVKVGPVEHIRDLVNLQLPGITLQVLPIAPRQIPYHTGFTYFQLDRQSETWTQLLNSGGLAIHVSGKFPELEMELWTINH